MRSPAGWRGLVTGASGGLGRRIAEALAASGVDLVLTGRDLVGLNAVADTVRAQGRRATVLVADLSEPDAVNRLVSESNATAGPIDLLVNNAGVEVASAYTRYSEVELSQIISLDLVIPLQLIRHVLPGMVARAAATSSIFVPYPALARFPTGCRMLQRRLGWQPRPAACAWSSPAAE
jgi:3-oxoacyl-[acyl-carrier protein] reductase